MPSVDLPTERSVQTPSGPTKPFSISLPSSKPKHPLPSALKPLNPKKRPHSSLADSDSDNEATPHEPQLVSSFDHAAGGAIATNGVEKEKVPLVILAQRNRDWREESRRKRRKNLLPPEVQVPSQRSLEKDTAYAPREFGLNLVTSEARDGNGNFLMPEAPITKEVPPEEAAVGRTADEEALEALMGNGAKRSTTLVLPAVTADDEDADAQIRRFALNEDDSFRSDVASRPDSASLDEYAAVPIEEFGAALLRGMGWKDGDSVGKRKNQIFTARVVERRPALLGIGAKEVPGVIGEELGAWGKATTKGKRKVEKAYTPVLLRNTKTGEMHTEEELEAMKETQKREEIDWRERRDRNLGIGEGKKSERKDRDSVSEEGIRRERRRDKGRDDEERRYTSSRRDRSRSPDHQRNRRRGHKDDERAEKIPYGRDSRRDEWDDSRSWRHGYRDREDGRRRKEIS